MNTIEATKDYWAQNPQNYRYMKHWGKWGKKNTTLEDLWTTNTLVNREYIKDFESVWKLPACEDKATIVIGASPNIKSDCKYLTEIPDHYVTISVNSALKLLLNHGIKPTYVIAVDGGPGVVEHLDIGDDSKDLTLLACNSLDPRVFKAWKGEVKITPYTAIKDKEGKAWVRKTFGKELPSGGNAFNNAAALAAYVLKTSVIVFMGNELSWKGRNYYADKPSFNDGTLVFPARGVDGRSTYTNTVLYQYKIWLEAFCQQNSHIVFYNCSRGILGYSEMTGYTPNIYHMDFPEAYQEINVAMRQFHNVEDRERIKYNIGYADDDAYNPTVGEGAWQDVISQVKFKRGLDVGCGPGYGIKIARDAGFEVFGIDIADGLQEKWKEVGVEKWCDPAPASKIPAQDNTFDLVLCTEVMEHIPEELVMKSLKEIRRVSCGIVYFSIANRYIPKDHKWIADQFQPHLTVKPISWWKKQLKEAGFSVKRVAPLGEEPVSNLYVCR